MPLDRCRYRLQPDQRNMQVKTGTERNQEKIIREYPVNKKKQS